MENLWPKSIALTKEQITPVSILKWQASILGEKTQNLVRADVVLRASKDLSEEIEDIIYYDFVIVAPLLNNYRFKLFTTEHDITKIYPIDIFLERQLSQELYKTVDPEVKRIQIMDEAQFIAELKKIFSSETTTNVIKNFSSHVLEKRKDVKANQVINIPGAMSKKKKVMLGGKIRTV